VAKAIDTGEVTSIAEAVVVDILLLSLFAVQHSLMARTAFKRWWTQFIPAAIERSTYVLLASLALILLFWQWRPVPAIVWQANKPRDRLRLCWDYRFLAGSSCFSATSLINHFELFGLQQVINISPRAP